MAQVEPAPAPAPAPAPDALSLRNLANEHPWHFYERVREQGSIVWDQDTESWLVGSFELCKEISVQDRQLWRSVNVPADDASMFGISLTEWIELIGFGSEHGLTVIDGPEHMAQHRWWMRTFSPRQLDDWRAEYFEPIIRAEVAKFRGDGRADLVSQLGDIVPRRMLAAIVGLPYQDDELLDKLDSLYATRQAVIYAVRTGVRPSRAIVEEASGYAHEMHQTLAPFIDASRPGGDESSPFIVHMWNSAESLFGPDYTLDDVTNLASAVWEGGTGTTKNAVANLLYLMATQPRLQTICASDDVAARMGVVEESLRLYGPVVVNSRIAREDITLGGEQVKAGQRVVMLNNAAGVDDRRYECPFEVDPYRKQARSHFSFGQGVRACPGQHLARVELETVAAVVGTEIGNLRLDESALQPQLRGGLLRRWEPLHVLFG